MKASGWRMVALITWKGNSKMRLKLQCHTNQLTFHLNVEKKKINPIPLEPQGLVPSVNSLFRKPFSSPGLLGISVW